MKKIALLLVLSAIVATPAVAAAKKKSHQMTFDEAMAYNKKNLSLVVQALPLVLPTWSLPIYFKMQKDNASHGKKKKR